MLSADDEVGNKKINERNGLLSKKEPTSMLFYLAKKRWWLSSKKLSFY
jgi:hypothetical protein